MPELTTTQQWLTANQFGEIVNYSPVGGGSINDSGVITLSNGTTLFLKTHPDPPADFFCAEAHGLNALRQSTSLRIPKVIHADRHFLLMEYLGVGEISVNYWSQLGEQLAKLHAKTMAGFGFSRDNYCGITLQHNPLTTDGYKFFAEHRLLAPGSAAFDKGLLESSEIAALESIASRLSQLIPEQLPVLLHGDLWSGNVHCDKEGQPALVDPACYWGWAEAELAMSVLFGGFDKGFYRAYEINSAIAADWRDRSDLYNLYHLLNHLNMFGTAYSRQARSIINKYA